MATNNAINQNGEGVVHYNESNGFTAVPMNDGEILIGVGSNSVASMPSFYLGGQNCTFCNLSFTHSAGTLTIAGADGTALSTTNPGIVCLPSNATDSNIVTHVITANQTLTVSDMTGNIGNMTASTAYSNSFPLYIGFMSDNTDSNLVGVLTWLPHAYTAPTTSSNIGDPSAANADKQFSCFAFDDITEANFTDSNIGLIGSLTATKNASDVYTLDALTAQDGVGRFNDSRFFTFATGLFGASASTYMVANGGTAPTFTTNEVSYRIAKDGFLYIHYYMTGDGGTDGATSVDAFPAVPFAYYNGFNSTNLPFGGGTHQSSVLGIDEFSIHSYDGTPTTFKEFACYIDGTTTPIKNSDFGNGDRTFRCYMEYLTNGVE